jgi:uncharacterized protein YjeT (DUF2065 family)
MFAWPDLLRALALFMVIEGVLPFVSPQRSRNMFARLAACDDKLIRTLGFLCMLGGLVALQALHWLS